MVGFPPPSPIVISPVTLLPTLTRELRVTFKIPQVCDYITKLRWPQAVLPNHEDENVRKTGKCEVQRSKYKRPSSLRAFS
jgi:hypothetical protein